MASDTPHTLSGFLLEWPEREVKRSGLERLERVSFKGNYFAPGWDEYELAASEPLRGEERPGATVFRYPVTFHWSDSRLLVLSVSRNVVEHLMNADLRALYPPLYRVSIAVDRFVKDITLHPADYTLSFIHAKVPAFGAMLRSASFYGDDLAEASLFRDHLHLMTCFTCGVRNATGGAEILRIGNDGAISFGMGGGRDKLMEVEAFLDFLRCQGYITLRPGFGL